MGYRYRKEFFRNDYTPPPAMTQEEISQVADIVIRTQPGMRITNEVFKDGVLIGFVRRGNQYKSPLMEIWLSIDDYNDSDPEHGRALLKLLKLYKDRLSDIELIKNRLSSVTDLRHLKTIFMYLFNIETSDL